MTVRSRTPRSPSLRKPHWTPASRTHCPRRGATTLDTEILTDEGKLQLDSVLNMGTRRLAGFVLSEHHDSKVAYGDLPMAVVVAGLGSAALPGVTFTPIVARLTERQSPRTLANFYVPAALV